MKKALKIVAIFAAMAVAAVSFAACGEDSGKDTSTPAQQSSVVSQNESSKDEESSEEENSDAESSADESSEEESSEESQESETSLNLDSHLVEESSAAESSAVEESSATEDSGVTGFGSYATLEELINQDYMQEMIATQVASYADQGITVDVYVEDGTKLVYEGVYQNELTEGAAEAMQEYLETESIVTTYSSIASSVQAYIEQSGVSVVVRFKDKDGNVVAEKEYFQE